MSKAVKSLWNLSKDELTRERLEAEETHRRDSVAILEYARNEGIEQGLEKGIEQGHSEGHRKGEGHSEGHSMLEKVS